MAVKNSPPVTNMQLSSVIRYHRKKAGLSQSELARLAGVGKTAVFDLEKGKESVRCNTLLKVLQVLNIQLSWESPLKELYLKARAEEHGDASS